MLPLYANNGIRAKELVTFGSSFYNTGGADIEGGIIEPNFHLLIASDYDSNTK